MKKAWIGVVAICFFCGWVAAEEEQGLSRKFLLIALASQTEYVLGEGPPKRGRVVPPGRCESKNEEPLYRCVPDGKGGKQLVPWNVKPEARELFEKAEKLYASGQLSEALKLYDQVLELDPEFGLAWLFSGDVPFKQGDFPEALRRYRKVLDLDPTVAQAHRFADDALWRMGRKDEAVEEYLKALALRPTYKEAESSLRDLLNELGYFFYRLPFEPPDEVLPGRKGKRVYVPLLGKATDSSGWFAFSLCQAVWQFEPSYRPELEGKTDPWFLDRDAECVEAFWENSEGLKKLAESVQKEGDVQEKLDAQPEAVRHWLRVLANNLQKGYTLVEYYGMRCPSVMRLLPEPAFQEALAYLDLACIVPDARRLPGPTPTPQGPQN
jgi:tetratricopeptide (TPR) repeat protein